MRRVAGAALALLLAAGCGAGPREATGVVVEVQGDLARVEHFTIRTPEGETLTFVPHPEARFHGGPLSHLRQHLVSGQPVTVRYEPSSDGTLVAVEVGD